MQLYRMRVTGEGRKGTGRKEGEWRKMCRAIKTIKESYIFKTCTVVFRGVCVCDIVTSLTNTSVSLSIDTFGVFMS